MRVAFLGLGIMGQSMATNLVKAGHEVTIWNRTPGKLVEGAGAESNASLLNMADESRPVEAAESRPQGAGSTGAMIL